MHLRPHNRHARNIRLELQIVRGTETQGADGRELTATLGDDDHLREARLAAKPADGSERRTVYDAGAQVDLTFTVLSRLNMTLSFGYAAGFEDGHKLDDEWMLSLKIL